jgi:general secretion pathway protein G
MPACLALSILLVLANPASAAEVTAEPRDLLDHIPDDPIFVSVASGEDLVTMFDDMLGFVGRLGDEDAAGKLHEGLAKFDEKIGCSLRDDLLAGLGTDFAFVLDLPPIDQLMAAMMTGDPTTASLPGIGLLAAVRERERFDACLRRLFGLAEGVEILEEGDLVRIRFPTGTAEPGDQDQAAAPLPDVSLYYAFRDDLFVLGAESDWVAASLDARPAGQRLADGGDFSRVFAHLDDDSERLTYLNLPKVREMVLSSAMLQGMIASNPEVKSAIDLFLGDDFTAVGLGSTAVSIDDGVRTTSFGPSALSGGAAMHGVIAAIAIPNLLNAIDRGKQKRSMADIRSVGTALEAYSIDTNVYPSTESQWVPVEQIAPSLAPTYIRELPLVDGWGHPLMFWSNGTQCRIVSPGKDGEISRDWSGEIEPGATGSFDADIVFGNGAFLIWPEGKQE